MWDEEDKERERWRSAKTEQDQAEILRLTSPEFQTQVKKQKDDEDKRQREQAKMAFRKQATADFEAAAGKIAIVLFVIAMMVGALYVLIKFVKWAWFN